MHISKVLSINSIYKESQTMNPLDPIEMGMGSDLPGLGDIAMFFVFLVAIAYICYAIKKPNKNRFEKIIERLFCDDVED